MCGKPTNLVSEAKWGSSVKVKENTQGFFFYFMLIFQKKERQISLNYAQPFLYNPVLDSAGEEKSKERMLKKISRTLVPRKDNESTN